MSKTYRAFGLILSSELHLPGLRSVWAPADVVIRYGDVPRKRQAEEPFAFGGTPDRLTFEWKDLAQIAVIDGRRVILDAEPDADPRSVRALILGPVMGALLHQLGLLVLHASAVAIGGRAVAFVGPSGSGKSTLAAHLCVSGQGLVTDDILAVDALNGTASAYPGVPELKLWPESVKALGERAEAFERVHPELTKVRRGDIAGAATNPLPLGTVYVLERGASPRIEALEPQDSFLELVRHSFCARLLSLGGAADHFRQCASVAGRIPVRRLVVSRTFAELDRVADLILRDRDASDPRPHLVAAAS